MRSRIIVLLLIAGVATVAWAQNTIHADQGKPGTQGCWPVCSSGSTVIVGPDGGSVPVNITQSITLQVFMDGGQHMIADQGAPGASPWACYVAMDGGQQITVNQGTNPWVVSGTVTVAMDGGQTITVLQGTNPWACYVATDGGQHFIVDQGTNPWTVAGTVTVAMDGGQTITALQGTVPWAVNGILDGGFLGSVVVIFDGGVIGSVNLNVDGGYLGATSQQPCRTLLSTNTSVGTSAIPVPATPLASRIWIQVCNSLLNSGSTQCICAANTCPTFAASSVGDPLNPGDCALYNLTTQDAGVPCCICNGAGSRMPATECTL